MKMGLDASAIKVLINPCQPALADLVETFCFWPISLAQLTPNYYNVGLD